MVWDPYSTLCSTVSSSPLFPSVRVSSDLSQHGGNMHYDLDFTLSMFDSVLPCAFSSNNTGSSAKLDRKQSKHEQTGYYYLKVHHLLNTVQF